jgi:hypothetical protein
LVFLGAILGGDWPRRDEGGEHQRTRQNDVQLLWFHWFSPVRSDRDLVPFDRALVARLPGE